MNPTPILFVAVICVLVGIAIGTVISGLTGVKKELSPPPSPELIEVAHLMRDRRSGNLIIELRGHHVRNPASLSSSQRLLLQKAVVELQAWLGKIAETSQPSPVGSAPEPPAAPMRPSMNPVDVMSRAFNADAGKQPVIGKSIAAQIDEILQERLEGSPLKDRAIRLMELPGKGMVVMVGLKQYDGVNSVPDAEIRNLLRECVEEWEQRVEGA
jgi:hypothetical protein